MPSVDLEVNPRDRTPAAWLDALPNPRVYFIPGHPDRAAEMIARDLRSRGSGRRPRPIVDITVHGLAARASEATALEWATRTRDWIHAVIGPESILLASAMYPIGERYAVRVGAVPVEAGRVSWQARLTAYLTARGERGGPSYSRLARLYIRDVGASYDLDPPTLEATLQAAKRRAREASREAEQARSSAAAATAAAEDERAACDTLRDRLARLEEGLIATQSALAAKQVNSHEEGQRTALDAVDSFASEPSTPEVVRVWWASVKRSVYRPGAPFGD